MKVRALEAAAKGPRDPRAESQRDPVPPDAPVSERDQCQEQVHAVQRVGKLGHSVPLSRDQRFACLVFANRPLIPVIHVTS